MSPRAARRRAEVHVFREADGGRWIVASARRAVSRHRTQRTAVASGTRVAKRQHVDLVVHNRAGRFRSKDSYGIESPGRDAER